MRPTYRDTVLLGKKLGCRVSIRSTSSHTTLTRTCCLLSSLDLSAEQWQLSTIRSGQFLLPRLEPHSPTITHSRLGALMADPAGFCPTRAPSRRCPPSLRDESGPFHAAARRLTAERSPGSSRGPERSCAAAHLQLQTFSATSAVKPEWGGGSAAPGARGRRVCASPRCSKSSKLFCELRGENCPAARFQSPEKLRCGTSFSKRHHK